MRSALRWTKPVLAMAMVLALAAACGPALAGEPEYKAIRDINEVPVIAGAYLDDNAAARLLGEMEIDHGVVGTLRRRMTAVFFVDQYVDDVTRWYEKSLGYPSLTLDDLGMLPGIGPGGESPIYYSFEYHNFPDSNGYDDYGRLIWPGVFITEQLAATRKTWMRGAILKASTYGWYFKDMENSVTDVMLFIVDAGFDFEAMTYAKKTAVVISWEVYEPYVAEQLPQEGYDAEYEAWMKDVEGYAKMLMETPPTSQMLDVPINKDMMFDPYTTAMFMMDGEPMYTFYWDIEPSEAMRLYSEEMKLKPEVDEDGWVFVFSGRLPSPMHALFIYPNYIEGVPFKTVIFVRKEVVNK